MAKLLNLARAARLVGVSRGALQKRIHDGVLDSFDGMVTLEELQRVFPHAVLEDNTVLEHVENIKDKAFGRRVAERALPDKEVLAARVHELSKELVQTKAQLKQSLTILEGLGKLLGAWTSEGGARSEFSDSLRNWLREQHLHAPVAADYAQSLMIRDSFLRVMTAQVKVMPSGVDFFVEGGDSILEAALRAGIALGYGCSSGNCGSCRARVVQGEVKQMRAHEFVLRDRDKGYFLACSYTAVSDLVIEAHVAQRPEDINEQNLTGEVRAIEHPSPEVAVVHVKTPVTQRLRFLAGQRARLSVGGSLALDLPIASCPCEDRHLEFHIKRLRGNPFSDYVFDKLRAGDSVDITGPKGRFSLDTESTRPIVFIAFCTGFAPVKSLMEHAMALEQAESIHLYWIAPNEDSLYLPGLARAWADALDDFHYEPIIVGRDMDTTDTRQESAIRHVIAPKLASLSTLARSDVYVAGLNQNVASIEKMLDSLGVPREQIHIDYET